MFLKTLSFVCVAVLATGCLTTSDQPSREEFCAEQGMIVDGVTLFGRDKYGNAIGSVNCRQPADDVAKCKVSEANGIARARQNMNHHAQFRNWAIGFGYMMYVVPGYLLLKMWEDDHAPYVENYRNSVASFDKCESGKSDDVAH